MKPRLGFAGVGWIGLHRLQAVLGQQRAEVVALADADEGGRRRAAEACPNARLARDFDELLSSDLDGIVIATPSAMHARQCLAAFERGLSVFCQKPLGRDGQETRAVVAAARAADRLLGVDMCYRHTRALETVRRLVRSGELGRIYAAELVFHNAYGPDKDWFYDMSRSGGGCVMDLGIHLVDAALWVLGGKPETLGTRRFAGGLPLAPESNQVEDYASALLELNGAAVNLSCSWRLAAGKDARIEAAFYGTGGGVALRNEGGSFYDFVVERYRGTSTEVLLRPPDAWGGRAVTAWVAALADGARYVPADDLIEVADALDALYGRSGRRRGGVP